ncbi:MAG TPA: glycosyltransferase [Puia sp.]|jgi:glycosyltransferase involved in cell wall biosynthesis|nr:glycosyltransferase [Puia sp.]
MKIAIISMIREPWGGSEELWYEMAKHAIAAGHTVIHLSYDFGFGHPRYAELRRLGAHLYQRPGYFPPGISARQRMWRTGINFIRKKLRNPFKTLFDLQPDIVLYNGTCYSVAREGALLKALAKSPARFYLLGHLNSDRHHPFTESERLAIIGAYERAKEVYFISKRSLVTAERQLCHPIPNAAVIRNPVNMPETGSMSIPPGLRVNLALVGNLIVSHKGQDILLAVLQTSKWRDRDWTLNIYGDGPDKGYLQQLVDYYRLGDRVVFHGRVGDIRQVWRENHLLVMPSHMEGMPLAIVEAMLCGRPCVATDVGGVTEWIEDGLSGFIAEAATEHALDRSLERVWEARDRWAEIGARAHERAMALYDPAAGRTLLDRLTKQD